MRMWMVIPELLCRRHLLGEHVETHMLAGSVRLGKTLDGFVSRGLVELDSLEERHGALAKEMSKRKYRHGSALELPQSKLERYRSRGTVDVIKSLRDLAGRCSDCADRIHKGRVTIL